MTALVLNFSLESTNVINAHSGLSCSSEQDLDEYEAKVIVASELLDQVGAKFHFSGFGLDDWALDVKYDLSVFMESLPNILNALRNDEECELFFASQGVQRTLTFAPAGESVRIFCESMTSWVPNPSVEVMELSDLLVMLTRLATSFGVALAETGSPLSEEEPFVSWAKGRVN